MNSGLRGRIDELVKPSGTHATHTPEDRVTRAMEIQEDIMKKVEFLEKQVNTQLCFT